MMIYFKPKNIIILCAVIVIASATFYFVRKNVLAKPYIVVTPSSYSSGTVVSLYKNLPPSFPTGIMLENNQLNYSGTVSVEGAKSQITVSYLSDKNIIDATNLYSGTLPKSGWTLATKSIGIKSSAIIFKRGVEKLILTVATTRTTKTMVTFQYEK